MWKVMMGNVGHLKMLELNESEGEWSKMEGIFRTPRREQREFEGI